MDEELELEIVDLGDAKELTQGAPSLINSEDNPAFPQRV
ncbi:MAG: benenodin family lasso peptide [Rubrivivax sp.]|uniref:Uncharacterized protein n=1 Tax=Rubrivivax gelatinosus (strain NBRC 100245 / IL144) TaxID=983917 RepID=I0HM07_RUBGI|nr:rubrivinodin family lasso peptide [Rubrivivax gelatinosus]BAL94044.1 hypothetical protein RGE_06990 [Rubrivivax gelatinosus IL144]